MTFMHIDQSVYPDLDHPPVELLTEFDKADYIHRICAAWDFGILPDPQTFELFAGWQEIFDRFPLSASPAYHALRSRFGWPPIEWPHGILPPMPQWERQDQIEGRGSDPCERLI